VTPTPVQPRHLSRALVTGSLLVALTLGTSVVLTGSRTTTPPAEAGELPSFPDCAALRRHMADLALPLVTAWGLGGGASGLAWFAQERIARDGLAEAAVPGAAVPGAPVPGAPVPGAAMPGAASSPSSADSTGGAVGTGPTGTNVQERGVDEPDLAKTDGRLVVTVNEGALHVVDAGDAPPRRRGTLSLRDQAVGELLLLEDRALVVGQRTLPVPESAKPGGGVTGNSGTAPDTAIWDGPVPGARQRTVLTLVDLRDPDRPAVLGTHEMDGSYLSARLRGGVARVVVASQPRLRFTMPVEPGPVSEAKARAANRAAVREATERDWLPQQVVRDAGGRVTTQGLLVTCSNVRYPVKPSGVGLLSVLTLDLTGEDPFARGDATAVVGDGDLVYASTDRLYVATTVGGWGRPLPAIAGGAVGDVAVAPQPARTVTKVHAFDVTGRRRASYVASGTVDGYLLNRWAMSEHEGRLRVAATTGPPWAPGERSESSVVVFEERGRQLVRVGSVGGLGKGERVHAVRWFGDLAAVVTFRQTDPLYLVDLSRPAQPRVRGELKIPGYSAYLHPIGGGRLLGVGQDADAEGRVKGVQLSVFDVSDPSRPRRIDALFLGSGHTAVEHDSRAFTYLPERRLAVLPMWQSPSGGEPEQKSYVSRSVAVGVTVGQDGTLRETGRHRSPDMPDVEVQRVLAVGSRLAAVSATEVSLLDPDGLLTLGSVRLP
jgi:hypothetical protein